MIDILKVLWGYRMMKNKIVLLFLIFIFSTLAFSAELDQFSFREKYEKQLTDSTELLNKVTNEFIQTAINSYNKKYKGKNLSVKEIHKKIAFEIYNTIAAELPQENEVLIPERVTLSYAFSKKTTGPLQQWLNDNIKKIEFSEWEKDIIYYLYPYPYNKSNFVKINNYLVGTDKIDHFFDQGFSYWQISKYGMDDQKAIDYGISSEYDFFGLKISGVFSFADLRANWKGYQFYKSLLTGRNALIMIKKDGSLMQRRAFNWKDWVDWQFDELLNPCYYTPFMKNRIALLLIGFEKINNYSRTYEYLKQRGIFDTRSRTDEYLNDKIPKEVDNIFDLEMVYRNFNLRIRS